MQLIRRDCRVNTIDIDKLSPYQVTVQFSRASNAHSVLSEAITASTTYQYSLLVSHPTSVCLSIRRIHEHHIELVTRGSKSRRQCTRYLTSLQVVTAGLSQQFAATPCRKGPFEFGRGDVQLHSSGEFRAPRMIVFKQLAVGLGVSTPGRCFFGCCRPTLHHFCRVVLVTPVR